MESIRVILRADDAASSHSANRAIAQCVKAGTVKNVSLMAPGAFLEEAAALLLGEEALCFGMHLTLNAEWDKVKWGPLARLPAHNGLTDENGMFLPDPALFAKTKPALSTILAECEQQLNRLTQAGFPVAYLDTHMFPELYLPGLEEALREWAQRKGLLYHLGYYGPLDSLPLLAGEPEQVLPAMRAHFSGGGQVFYVLHPALYGEEMLQTGNRHHSGQQVARQRNREAVHFASPATRAQMEELGIQPICYTQAQENPALHVEDLRPLFGLAE